MALHSDLLKDSCFFDLEESISTLKRYDPVSYFELEGIGKRYDYLKTNYTIPFLKSTNPTEFGLSMNRQFIDKLLNEIEEHLRGTAKQISNETYKRIEKKIENLNTRDAKDHISEFNENFYEFIIGIIPEDMEKPTYEEFVKGVGEPEMRDMLKSQFELMAKAGVAAVTELVMSDPSLTLEEVADRLGYKENI